MDKSYVSFNNDNLNDNIKNFKNSYDYKYYILNVSNNAFHQGIEIVKYLTQEFDFLYTINFNDIIKIRKYNHNIKIIYNGVINEDNIYDLVLNDAILVIKSKELMDFILSLKIKDKFEIIFGIDTNGYDGFNSKTQIADIIEDIKKDVHIGILGIIANVSEDSYDDFKYIINPLKNLELAILNSENDKNKIKLSNAIILDKSIYGIDVTKKKLFNKEKTNLKPILEVMSYVSKVCVSFKGKKEIYVGVVPLGINNGLSKLITKVYINDRFYNIKEIKEEFTLVEIDSTIKAGMRVEVIGSNNRLDSYVKDDVFNILGSITFDLEKIYDKNVCK